MPELITLEDLLEHVDRAELTQVAGTGSHNVPEGRALDTVKIDAAIKYASDMVRGYITRRFPLFSNIATEHVPDLVKGYTADVVRYRLRARSGNQNAVTDEVEQRFKDAKSWLLDVSRGLINVDLSDAPGGDEASEAGAVNPNGAIHATHEDTRAGQILDGYR